VLYELWVDLHCRTQRILGYQGPPFYSQYLRRIDLGATYGLFPMFREAVAREPWRSLYRTWKAHVQPDRGGVRLIGKPTGKAIGVPCGDIVLIQQSELLPQRIIKVKLCRELEKRMPKDIPLFESAVVDGLQRGSDTRTSGGSPHLIAAIPCPTLAPWHARQPSRYETSFLT
jgi:hypothetical protein